MSRELIVTSFGPALAELGQRCLESIWRHWPVPAVVYVDPETPITSPYDPMATADIPGFVAVRDTLATSHPYAEKPTNYSWNAKKYAVKPFVWQHSARAMGEGVLVWLDADTEVIADIPAGFASSVLKGGHVADMGRGPMHPETGVVVFRIPQAMPILDWCVDAYRTGAYMTLAHGWTDCHVLRAGIVETAISSRDLTGHLHDGPWRSAVDAVRLSPFGPYLVHHKGAGAKRVAESHA